MLVSIITPSYNQSAYLEQAIQSVLGQDYTPLEYIVVDGGSADGSAEIIQRYASRLAWWVSERDAGQADAINKGLRRASGEIVAWLNSDDLYQPGAIAQAVAALRDHPEAGLAFGDAITIDARGRTIDVALTAREFAARRRRWRPKRSAYDRGVLAKYRRLVGPASGGAVTDEA